MERKEEIAKWRKKGEYDTWVAIVLLRGDRSVSAELKMQDAKVDKR